MYELYAYVSNNYIYKLSITISLNFWLIYLAISYNFSPPIRIWSSTLKIGGAGPPLSLCRCSPGKTPSNYSARRPATVCIKERRLPFSLRNPSGNPEMRRPSPRRSGPQSLTFWIRGILVVLFSDINHFFNVQLQFH